MTHFLDNVIFNALKTRQSAFAQGAGAALRFMQDIGPLAGFREPDNAADAGYAALAEITEPGGTVVLFLREPCAPREGWSLIATPPLLQMAHDGGKMMPEPSGAAPLTKADAPEMLALATEAKPGPFGPRTHELGDFFGVRFNGRLVAMAGERMKLPGYTEVSAVCTHPGHLGKGHAAACMRPVIDGIQKRGETPFLHVLAENARAIELYARLGFKPRWRGFVAVLRRD